VTSRTETCSNISTLHIAIQCCEDFFLQYYFSNVAAIFLKYFQQETQIDTRVRIPVFVQKLEKNKE